MGEPKPRAKKRRSQAHQDQLARAQHAHVLQHKRKLTPAGTKLFTSTIRSTRTSYVSTLETRVISAENMVDMLELEPDEERSTNATLRTDFNTAS